MRKSTLIDILNFPAKKGNNLKPWYRVVWVILLLPFFIVFGIGFYISILVITFSPYFAETFRKEWLRLTL